jgi:hypothetical protein
MNLFMLIALLLPLLQYVQGHSPEGYLQDDPHNSVSQALPGINPITSLLQGYHSISILSPLVEHIVQRFR